MTAPYGLDDAQMTSVIQATQQAIDEMHSVNQSVTGTSGDIGAANQSTSGGKTQTALIDWTSVYTQIINDITVLNSDVTAWQAASRAASSDATSAAPH